MVQDKTFFTSQDAQPTSISNSSVDDIFDIILSKIHPVDFNALATVNRDRIFEALLEQYQQQSGEDESDLTPQDTRELLESGDQISLSPKVYKVLFIMVLIDLSDEIGYPLADFGAEVRVYSGTHWLTTVDDQLIHFVMRAGEKIGVPRFIALDSDFAKKCIRQLQAAGYRKKIESNETMINFLNGTLKFDHLGNYTLGDHSPDDLLTYVLPYEFDESAEAPVFEKYLDRVLPDEQKQDVLAEFIASCFTNHKHEKALILYGDGANGKSVFLEVITSALGNDNVCSHTLESLTDKSGYYRGQLGDYLLNYSGEISTSLNPDEFKKLASREKISARYPYGRPFTIENYARIAFNCNELPEAEDTSEGFFRRFLIIEFDQYIRKEERDRDLHNKIIDSDLPGVMNWILKGVKRLTEQGTFSQCDSADRHLEIYRKEADTVQSFAESEDIKKMGEEAKASILHEKYLQYCSNFGYTPVGEKTFYIRLARCGLQKKRKSDGMYYLRE